MDKEHGWLCTNCHQPCRVRMTVDIGPPIRLSDCCGAPVGLTPERTRRVISGLEQVRREYQRAQERHARAVERLQAEIDRRGRLIEEQERDLDRLRMELRERR